MRNSAAFGESAGRASSVGRMPFNNRSVIALLLIPLVTCMSGLGESAENDTVTIDASALPDTSRFKEAVSYLDEAIQNSQTGDADAAYHVGLAYYYGDGITEDKAVALRFFKQAAQSKHAQAAVNSGHILQHGLGVNRDLTSAFAYYMLAANLDSAEGAFRAGAMLYNGEANLPSKSRDEQLEKTYSLLEMALEQQVKGSHFYFGCILEYGTATHPADYHRAEQLYRYCCEQGDAECCYHRGLMYAYGRYNFEQDLANALEIFRDTWAKYDHVPSAYYLGMMHAYASGVERDLELARFFLELAARSNHPLVSEQAKLSIREFSLSVEALGDLSRGELEQLKASIGRGKHGPHPERVVDQFERGRAESFLYGLQHGQVIET